MTSIIKVDFSSVNYEALTEQSMAWAKTHESRYICAANVHMIMEAFDSPQFLQVVNQADMVVPDGMPLVWMLRLKGKIGQQRVYGPIMMLRILEAATQKSVPVGFYGGSPKTLEALLYKLRAKYPNLKIVYSFSPPFHKSNEEEDAEIVEQINISSARIMFIGLGCPKQEIWMAEHRGRVNAVMLGVGAAFDFHANLKPQAPAWIQNVGMEWFFRLLTEPRRLWRRYLYHNPRFIFLAILDLIGLIR